MLSLGDLNPHLFYHPPLLLYCTALLSQLLNLLEIDQSRGIVTLIAGRSVSALAGTVSILLVYLLARLLVAARGGSPTGRVAGAVGADARRPDAGHTRASSRRGNTADGPALAAAALFAFAPLSVTCSRYLKEDSLLLAGVLSATLLWVMSVQRQSHRWFLLAGFVGGIAAATKYTGFLVIPLIGIWPWVISRRWRPDRILLRWTAAALCLAAVSFFVVTPFAIISPRDAASGFLFEAKHAVDGHYSTLHQAGIRIGSWSQWWMYHAGRSMVPGLTLLPSVCAFMGLGMLFRRRRREDLFVLGLFLLFFLPAEVARSKPHPQPERYILPALPFLCIAAAQVVRFLSTAVPKKWISALLVLLIASPLIRSLHLASDLYPDTRAQLVSWTLNHLPAGSKLYLDTSPTYSGRFDRTRMKKKPRTRYGTLLRWREKQEEGFTHLVETSFGSGRFLEQPNPHHEIQDKLREMRARLELVRVFRSSSGPYGFHNPVLRLYRLPAE